MSAIAGPNLLSNGLLLYLDAGNTKSYPGSGTTVTDLSRTGNNGTLVNTPPFSSSNLGSFNFNGTSQYISTNSPIIPNTTSFSVGVWVRYTLGFFYTFLDIINNRSTSTNNPGFLLTTDFSSANGRIRVQLNSASALTEFISSGANIATGNWVYVVISVNRVSNTMSYYVNGSLDYTTSISSIGSLAGSTNLFIAYDAAFAGPGNYFAGDISACHIYGLPLSNADVLQNFNALRGRYGA